MLQKTNELAKLERVHGSEPQIIANVTGRLRPNRHSRKLEAQPFTDAWGRFVVVMPAGDLPALLACLVRIDTDHGSSGINAIFG